MNDNEVLWLIVNQIMAGAISPTVGARNSAQAKRVIAKLAKLYPEMGFVAEPIRATKKKKPPSL